MVKFENHLGTISISQDYFANLVGKAASDCYGVCGMSEHNPVLNIRNRFSKKDNNDSGVRVRSVGGGLIIDLHIIVTYGVNIAAIVKSIVNNVRYHVETATGFTVAKVNVFVDGMKSE